MKTLDLNELLQNHPYPGRGIVLGRSADDKKAVIAYFIMGRYSIIFLLLVLKLLL